MKIQLTLCCLLVTAVCLAQNFEGAIKWSVTADITDPKLKAQMEESQKKMNDPATQAQMKKMQEQMNDPQFKAMMESNPQMKAQMESMMKMTQGGSMMPTGYTVKVKDGNSLTKMEGGMMAGTETLHLKDKSETYLINREAKTYTVLSPDAQQSASEHDMKVTKTAEKQKILNYTCTKTIVTFTTGGKSFDQIFWTTTEIKGLDFKSLANQKMGKGNQAMFYKDIEGVPLKTEMVTPEMKMVMQVTEIKKETVASSLFVIPAGFTETKLPGHH